MFITLLFIIIAGCGILGAGAFTLLLLFQRKIRPLWARIENLETRLASEQENRTLIEQSMASAVILPDSYSRLFRAQYGEDLLIWSFFERSQDGFFVEIGGYDGVTFSNTYALETLGWKGLIIEADPKLYRQCVQARQGSRCIHAAVGDHEAKGTISFYSVQDEGGVTPLSFVEADEAHRKRCLEEGARIVKVDVPYRSVNSLLEDGALLRIDVLSIDIEGMELQVLEAIDYERFAPRLIVVEANTREARSEILEKMRRKKYRLWRETSCNLLLAPVCDV